MYIIVQFAVFLHKSVKHFAVFVKPVITVRQQAVCFGYRICTGHRLARAVDIIIIVTYKNKSGTIELTVYVVVQLAVFLYKTLEHFAVFVKPVITAGQQIVGLINPICTRYRFARAVDIIVIIADKNKSGIIELTVYIIVQFAVFLHKSVKHFAVFVKPVITVRQQAVCFGYRICTGHRLARAVDIIIIVTYKNKSGTIELTVYVVVQLAVFLYKTLEHFAVFVKLVITARQQIVGLSHPICAGYRLTGTVEVIVIFAVLNQTGIYLCTVLIIVSAVGFKADSVFRFGGRIRHFSVRTEFVIAAGQQIVSLSHPICAGHGNAVAVDIIVIVSVLNQSGVLSNVVHEVYDPFFIMYQAASGYFPFEYACFFIEYKCVLFAAGGYGQHTKTLCQVSVSIKVICLALCLKPRIVICMTCPIQCKATRGSTFERAFAQYAVNKFICMTVDFTNTVNCGKCRFVKVIIISVCIIPARFFNTESNIIQIVAFRQQSVVCGLIFANTVVAEVIVIPVYLIDSRKLYTVVVIAVADPAGR